MISSISSPNTLSQMTEMRQRMFGKIDTNGDGKHDKDELAAMVANGPQNGTTVDQILSDYDTDGDGTISETEFEAVSGPDSAGSPPPLPLAMNSTSSADFIEQLFGNADVNDDGEIDEDELSQMSANAPEGAPSAEAMVSKLDTDDSGTISKSEFQAGAPNNQQGQSPMGPPASTDDIFSTLDTDGDGTISKSEFEAGSDTQTAANAKKSDSQNKSSQTDLVQMLSNALKSYGQSSSASWINEGDQGSFSPLYV